MYIILYTYPSVVVVVSSARIVQTKWYFRDFHRTPPPPPIIHNNIWLPYRLLLVNVFFSLSFLSFLFLFCIYIHPLPVRWPADLRIRYKFNSSADHLTKGVIKNGRGHRVQMRAIRVGTRVVFVRLFGYFFIISPYLYPTTGSDGFLHPTLDGVCSSLVDCEQIYIDRSPTREDWVTNFPRAYYILYHFMGVSENYRTSELSQSSFYLYYFFSVYNIMYISI